MSKTENRDFVLARLGVCRTFLAQAQSDIDNAILFFCTPDEDPKGVSRKELLDNIDADIGEAARAVQAGQELLGDVDWSEGEQDLPEDDEEGDEEEPEDDED